MGAHVETQSGTRCRYSAPVPPSFPKREPSRQVLGNRQAEKPVKWFSLNRNVPRTTGVHNTLAARALSGLLSNGGRLNGGAAKLSTTPLLVGMARTCVAWVSCTS